MSNGTDNLKDRMIYHGIENAEEILEKTAMAWKDNPLTKTPEQYLQSKSIGMMRGTPEQQQEALEDVQDIYAQMKSGPKKWAIPKHIFNNLLSKSVLMPATKDGGTLVEMEGVIPKYVVIDSRKKLPDDLTELSPGTIYQTMTFDNIPIMVKYRFNDYVFIWAV